MIEETHPFPPLLPPNATVLMMGTFPPTADKRCMEFHYPNFQNDMWRIYGEIFFHDPCHFQISDQKKFDAEKIKDFMRQRGIATCPTVRKAIREQGNASDRFLTVTEPVKLAEVLEQIPLCRWIFTTGGKATEILLGLLSGKKSPLPKPNQYIDFSFQERDLKLYRLPSTSRAYPLSFSKKVEAYRRFFQLVHLV